MLMIGTHTVVSLLINALDLTMPLAHAGPPHTYIHPLQQGEPVLTVNHKLLMLCMDQLRSLANKSLSN